MSYTSDSGDDAEQEVSLMQKGTAEKRRPTLPLVALAALVVGGVATRALAPGCAHARSSVARKFAPRPARANASSILVTGALGYIGSTFVALLLEGEADVRVTAVDDLSRSSTDTISRLRQIAESRRRAHLLTVVQQDASVVPAMVRLMREHDTDAVVHFAGNAYVGESMRYPSRYYENITVTTLHLLAAMEEAGVGKLVFSSSCATYGEPNELPIVETTEQRPTSPYGLSKLHAEQVCAQRARLCAVGSPMAISLFVLICALPCLPARRRFSSRRRRAAGATARSPSRCSATST